MGRSKIWEESLPGFDRNCKRRLIGFLQGALYRMLDDEGFEMNFFIATKKRELVAPKSELDDIASLIASFVPVWEMLRSCEDDIYKGGFWVAILPPPQVKVLDCRDI